jgi:NAD-dependent deacetylase
MSDLAKLKEIIEKSKKIVIFSGAGLSTNSGIPDFRSADGLYNQKTKSNIRPEEIIYHSFFMSNPSEFYQFYFSKMVYLNAKPNLAHKYFAKLEEEGKVLAVVTQNIDNLHQEAGSKRVYELHGSIMRNYCMKCHKFYGPEKVFNTDHPIPICDECGGIVKPDVVLYEEGLDDKILEASIKSISQADMLIVGGTSLMVYPAAGLIRFYNGNKLVLINKQETEFDNMANVVIHDSIGKAFSHIE